MDVQLQYTVPAEITVPISQGVTNTAPSVSQVTAGDINGDGHVDINDYNLLMQCFSDLSPPVGRCSPNLKTAADLDDDGKVDGTDYNEMLRVFASRGGP